MHLSEILVLISIFPLLTKQLMCPPTMTPVSYSGQSWCVKDSDTKATFCEAVKICRNSNMEIVSSFIVYLALRNEGLLSGGVDTAHWIGLTDALNERSSNRDGWVWMRDGLKTTTLDDIFHSKEPNDASNNEDCVIAFEDSLRDVNCQDSNRFYCYMNSDGSPVLSNRRPDSASFLISPIVSFSQPAPGCWIDQSSTRISDHLRCSVRCFLIGADCVGFYWNSVRRECIILEFFDASVELKYDNIDEKLKWLKYSRK